MTREEKTGPAPGGASGQRAAALVGRGRELGLIGSLLDRIAAGGGTLLFTGDPGVGKTVLLDEAGAAAEAAGRRVLRVAGAEFGAGANFSGLGDLLRPVLAERRPLRDLNQRALNVILGLASGSPPDWLILANAVLALLQDVASEPLAPLDRPIARLAAAGLTNKQIGERLHISHRTVAAYLYQLFPRLGITSRASLRDALDAMETPDPGD